MVTSYNNQVCKQAEIYYYDYISKENIEQIPENLIEHIGQCPHCRKNIDLLKNGLTSQKSTKSGTRQIAMAVTDLLNLHMAYIGDKVVCSTARPFLPVILDPNLGIRIPTPITVHLDHCRQCAEDLKTISSLKLTSTQSYRLSQLLADKADQDTVSCRQAQAAIPAVSSMSYKGISEQILKHLCTCEHCRQDLFEYRETSRKEARHENEARKDSVCGKLTMSDIFDYVVPYGLDPTLENAISESSISSHLRSCSACLAKIQTLHEIIYGIVEKAESKVATIYRFNEFSETPEPGGFDDLYAGYPINVEIATLEDIDKEQPATPIHSIAAARQKTPILNTSRLLRTGIIAVAGVLIMIGLFFRAPAAGAVTIDQINAAIGKAKNIYISSFVPDKAEPIQEKWFSRSSNILIMKTGDDLVLWDLKNNQKKTKTTGVNSVEVTDLTDDFAGDIKQNLSGILGLMPFYSISELPDGTEWKRVPDDELEVSVNNTEVYELTWLDKTNANLPVFSKKQFTVDSQTYRPVNIKFYRKLNANDEYILNSKTTVEYLDDSAMQAVIELFSK